MDLHQILLIANVQEQHGVLEVPVWMLVVFQRKLCIKHRCWVATSEILPVMGGKFQTILNMTGTLIMFIIIAAML